MKWFTSAAAAALLSLSAGVASAADVVKVGLIADYTGAFAMWGTQFQQAIEAAVRYHRVSYESNEPARMVEAFFKARGGEVAANKAQ